MQTLKSIASKIQQPLQKSLEIIECIIYDKSFSTVSRLDVNLNDENTETKEDIYNESDTAYIPSNVSICDLNQHQTSTQSYYGFNNTNISNNINSNNIKLDTSIITLSPLTTNYLTSVYDVNLNSTDGFEHNRSNYIIYCSNNAFSICTTDKSEKKDNNHIDYPKVGQWDISRLMGTGGFSRVYKCLDTKNNNVAMAMKMVPISKS